MGLSMAARGNAPLGVKGFVLEDARPARNIFSAALWAALYIVSIIGCFYSFANINPELINLVDPDYLKNAANCQPEGRRSLLSSPTNSPNIDAELGTHLAAWVSVSLLVSIAVSAGLMHLLRTCAYHVIMATVFMALSIPTFFSMSYMFSGVPAHTTLATVAGGAAVFGWVLVRWSKREIKTASSVLATSVHALAVNPSLMGHIAMVTLVGMFVCVPPLLWVAASLADGKFVPNPLREGKDTCVDAYGAPITCCSWETDTDAVAILVGFPVSIWSAALVNQVRAFVISGTVAQWFFAPHASTGGHAARSLAHGMQSSLGTNAAAAGIVAIFSALQSLSQVPLLSFVGSCLAAVSFVFAMFMTATAAITGEGLLAAGRRTGALLARNVWSTLAIGVSIPVAVMGLISVAFSLAIGGTVWAAYHYLHPSEGQLYPVVLGVVVVSVVMIMMSFLTSVIHNVADALMMAFMIEQADASMANEEMCSTLAGVMAGKVAGPAAGTKGAAPFIADSLEAGNLKLLT